MKKFKQAIIHIGLHKTGTTSIQEAFYERRAWLEEHGDIHYPGIMSNHSQWLVNEFCEDATSRRFNIKEGLVTKTAIQQENQKRMQIIMEGFAASKASCLFLSGEGLSSLQTSEVQAFRRWINDLAETTTIVAIFRHPFQWAASAMQERLKHGSDLTTLYEAPNNATTIKRRVSPWLETFGRDCVRVADFDSCKCHPQGLVAAFCDLTQLNELLEEGIPTAVHNESMSALGVELLNSLSERHPLFVDQRLNGRREFSDFLPFAHLKGLKYQIPAQIAERIAAESSEGLNWIEEHFGIRYNLELPETEKLRHEIPFVDPAVAGDLAELIADLYNGNGPTRTWPGAMQKELAAANTQLQFALEQSHLLQEQVNELRVQLKFALKQTNIWEDKWSNGKREIKSLKKQINRWNERSWWTRAFHKLRVKSLKKDETPA